MTFMRTGHGREHRIAGPAGTQVSASPSELILQLSRGQRQARRFHDLSTSLF